MGCCGKQRRSFSKKLNTKKQEIRSVRDIPDDQLNIKELRIKNRMIRVEKRNARIKRRNARAARIKARNERKALNN